MLAQESALIPLVMYLYSRNKELRAISKEIQIKKVNETKQEY
jgi:hypothetical protein